MGNPSQVTPVSLCLAGQASSSPLIVLMDEKPFSYACKLTFCLKSCPGAVSPKGFYCAALWGFTPFVLSHSSSESSSVLAF